MFCRMIKTTLGISREISASSVNPLAAARDVVPESGPDMARTASRRRQLAGACSWRRRRLPTVAGVSSAARKLPFVVTALGRRTTTGCGPRPSRAPPDFRRRPTPRSRNASDLCSSGRRRSRRTLQLRRLPSKPTPLLLRRRRRRRRRRRPNPTPSIPPRKSPPSRGLRGVAVPASVPTLPQSVSAPEVLPTARAAAYRSSIHVVQ